MYRITINFSNDATCVNEIHSVNALNVEDAIDKITDLYPYLIDDYAYDVESIVVVRGNNKKND